MAAKCERIGKHSRYLVNRFEKAPGKLHPSPEYSGISLIRNNPLPGPYRRTIPRVLWWS